MDSAQWMQEIGVAKSMDSNPRQVMEKKLLVRPQKEQAINCPRCNSTNTKFCYYNNYSLTQPRYFCKTCRRYWTEGGTLRNVPVGGGSRKNKKSTSSSSSQSIIQSHNNNNNNNNSISSHDHHPNPKIHINEYHDQQAPQLQDLNLGFQAPQDHYNHSRGLVPQFLEFPKIFEGRDLINTSSSSSSTSSSSAPISALNLLRNELAVKGFNSPFIAMAPPAGGNLETNAFFPSNNFQFNQECKPPPNLANFSFDGINNTTMINGGSINVFPFGGVMKRHSSTSEGHDDDQGKGLHENNSNGFWNGMLGGGSW